MRVILPGSYDPVTLGHLDIIRRASELFDEVFVVAFINPEKTYMFAPSERLEMLRLAALDFTNVTVDYYEGYVVDYMRENNIQKIIKGYRNEKDLEYEKPQAEYNFIHGGYETVFLKSESRYTDVSSSRVREGILAGEDFKKLLPKSVAEYISNIKS